MTHPVRVGDVRPQAPTPPRPAPRRVKQRGPEQARSRCSRNLDRPDYWTTITLLWEMPGKLNVVRSSHSMLA